VATGYRGTVHFTSSDGQASLPANYAFASSDNGVHLFSVTLKTAGTESITATDTSSSSLTGAESGISVSPAAASTLVASGFPTSTTAGNASNFTVTARDAYGNVATGYRGTVHFTSSDTQAALPANYTFVSADNGAHTFSAALKTAGTRSITATDTSSSSVTGTESGIVVSPAAASTFILSGFPTSITAGVAGSLTVAAKDVYGNVATGYRGTVHLTSSDSQASLPANYTFVGGDNGVHTFSVTLNTPGSQSITATDTAVSSLTGSEANITVNAASNNPGTLQFSSASYLVSESAGSITITVNRTVGATGAVSVQYATSPGTDRAGLNYAAASGTLDFANGQTSATFAITVMDDHVVEGNETVNLTLSNPTGGATLGTASKAVLTIRDEDGTPNQRYVAQVYLDLLNRQVDPTGLAAWSSFLSSGGSRTQMVEDIEASTEYRTDVVEAIYEKFLHRPADPSGLAAFVSMLGSGTTIEQAEAMIAGSGEFFQDGGATSLGFLDALYQDALDRAPDPTGLRIFEDAMAGGMTRQQVAAAIFASQEYLQDLVKGYYLQFLYRPADSGGLNAFVTAMQQGTTDQEVVADILASDEFYSQIE
jgi:Calx-beta domain/Domain of unknown function (DUF4214)